jgi:hypothetical protein
MVRGLVVGAVALSACTATGLASTPEPPPAWPPETTTTPAFQPEASGSSTLPPQPQAATTTTTVATEAALPDGLSRGTTWVRTHPMTISALIASMGDPPASFADAYFDDFGANALMLWTDGSLEVEAWQNARPDVPWITWLREDGRSVTLDGSTRVPGPIAGDLPPNLPGRIGYQVGDEPNADNQILAIAEAVPRIRASDPDALIFTNFSYWVPDIAGKLETYFDLVQPDLISTSEFNYGPAHYTVLGTFRQIALDAGIPYWEYLNAYIGQESGYERTHSVSDLRWQGFAGLAYGYTGHSWFIFQARDGAHRTATDWGGSIAFESHGDFRAGRTTLFGDIAQLNREMANLGRAITQLTSTDVRFIPADHPLSEQPLETEPWTPGAGGDPYIRNISAFPGQGPLEILTGFFVDDVGGHYAMIQNARHTHSTRPGSPSLPNAEDPGRIEIEFDFTDAPATIDRTRLLALDHRNGTVTAIPLETASSGRSRLDIVLPAGEPILFTYDDGSPFPLGPPG